MRTGTGIFGRAVVVLLLCAWCGAVRATSRNLYEWMGVAPVVALGTIVVDDERYVEMAVTETLVGARVGPTVQIDEKGANRDREPGEPVLRMRKGRDYLVLLEPAASRRASRDAAYQLVRGVQGAREVPLEGSAAFVDAARRLAAVHVLKDDTRQWPAFEEMLEDTNPLLVRTALDMILKFRRGRAAQIPVLRPLLDHPEVEVRANAARLIGQLADAKKASTEDNPGLLEEVIAKARRDPSSDVRAAATACLASLGGPSADVVLREIAREDPEQDVRYAALRALLQRKGVEQDPPKIDASPGGNLR